MKKLFKSQTLAIGLAVFSMFFGAGNIIFPLALGQYAGDQSGPALFGLILTAVIMPIAGVIAMILFDGNYRQFFGRLGRWPGFLLALIIISLLGPLGSTPRCIALSYTTLHASFLEISPSLFGAVACGVIFLCTIKRERVLALLGLVLTPLLLCSLIAIIAIGLTAPAQMVAAHQEPSSLFLHGLKEGYNTMDLLAAFFFSSAILTILKMRAKEETHRLIAMRASLVGAFLLMLVYIGFCYLAAFHGQHLGLAAKDELLSVITMKIAGPQAGLLVCVAIALACLTTAIALIVAFTDFIQKEVFKEKISYQATLAFALLITFFVSTFEFTGISALLSPILQISYPGLIVLTCLNIAHRLWGVKLLKLPVFFTFGTTALFYFISA